MQFKAGLPIRVNQNPLGFTYGPGIVGPEPERRSLDEIRNSLMNPNCSGPEHVYCIAMDVARREDIPDLRKRGLLFGAVIYEKGTLGRETVRGQGHVHPRSQSCGSSTCEVYEIWDGKACIYMQESGSDNAGKCYAVYANPGDVVIVPPGWVHATVNASPDRIMVCGAWCIRDYGFEYADVRRHGGIAFFPVWEDGILKWIPNNRYRSASMEEKNSRNYPEFRLDPSKSVYCQYVEDRDRFRFVTNPVEYEKMWKNYVP